MKRRFQLAVVVCAVTLAGMACNQKMDGLSGGKADLTVFEGKVSYMIGRDMGKSLKSLDTDIRLPAVMRGIEDVLNDREAALSDSQLAVVEKEFSEMMQQKRALKMSAAVTENKAAGETFLAENGKKAGVKTTASGLQYLVVKEGTGPKPTAADNVTVHYKGTLVNGTEFDNSYKRGQPVTFPVNGVIPGWGEGLQLMKTGGTYQLFVPAALAYGERGAGDVIPPNSTLIFDVELVSIAKAK